MQVESFLRLLAQREFLPDSVIERLRQQAAEKSARGKTVRIESLAELLVRKGQLTQHQASQLLTEVQNAGQASQDPDDFLLQPVDDEPGASEAAAEKWASNFPSPPDPPADKQETAETKEMSGDYSDEEASAQLRPVDVPTPEKPPVATSRRGGVAAPLEELAGTPAAMGEKSTAALRHKSEWDSPLILIGGGALLLIVLLGVLVWYLLRTDTGDAQLKIASQAMSDGAYTKAIEAYESFLESHPDHDEVGNANIQLALARIRRAVESTDPSSALATAQNEIKRVEGEAEFHQAGLDLASQLPKIAENLANAASNSDDAAEATKLADNAKSALSLVLNTKYVPKSHRPDIIVRDVQRRIESVNRRHQREQLLVDALANIDKALADKDVRAAYAARDELVSQHEELADEPRLMDAMAEITEQEVQQITFEPSNKSAVTTPREQNKFSTHILSNSGQAGTGSSESEIAFLRIDGALFAVDAKTGTPLWRRYVGVAPRQTPIGLSQGGVLVVDAQHGELLRLDATSGKLVWRQHVGGVVGTPVVNSDTAFLSTRENRLLVVDLPSGELRGTVQFLRPLATAPAIDEDSNRIVIVGEESTLYVLSHESLTAEAVIFVGHPAGSIVAGAFTRFGRICFAENYISDEQQAASISKLHVLSFDDQSKKWTETIKPLRLTGNVTRPLVTKGRRMVVVTDRGEVRVFDVAVGDVGEPLTPVASRPAIGDTSMDRFSAFVGDEFWLADNRLTRFSILSTGGTLRAQELPDAYRGDTFTGPLSVVGSYVVHVRKQQGQAGFRVAATSPTTGRAVWDVELAVPVSDMTRLDGADRIGISDFNGNFFALRAGDVALPDAALVREAQAAGDAGPSRLVPLTNERQLIQQRVGADTWSVYGVGENQVDVDKVSLPAMVSASIRPFGGGVLAPTQVGQVMLLDPVSGQQQATPFQPTIDIDSLPQFSPPVVLEGASRFVIADKTRQFFLVELKDSPLRLVEVAQSESFSARLVSRLCVAGNGVFAFNANQELVRFDVNTLEQRTVFNANRSVTWGPASAQDNVFFAISGQLYCLLSTGEPAWNTTVDARPIGLAALGEAEVIIALENGLVQKWNRISGAQKLLIDFAQPLAVGPLLFKHSLFCATYDRCVVEFTTSAEQPLASNNHP